MLTLSDRQFQRIVCFVRDRYGINLIKKRALIQGRLALDIQRRGFSSFDAYFDDVIAHPGGAECQRMIDKLSTNHTFFFREPDCLAHMRDVAVPAFARSGVRRLDIWCAASSTGQECYSIAMTLEDALHSLDMSYRILGSDINDQALAVAQAGVYDIRELAGIPEKYVKRFCVPRDERSFEISRALMERVTWKQINLAQPLRFFQNASFHLIFCRNVMIYFDASLKEAITDELHRIVRGDGFVYVGGTETLDMKRTRFQYLRPSVFEKRRTLP